MNNFAVFILSNGRPDRVYTYETLRRHGYTGRIVLVVDDLDKTKDEYIEKYGSDVVVFDKRAAAKTFDQADNFDDMRAIVYARNACFDIAENLGVEYFMQLDDDYITFEWRFDNYNKYVPYRLIKRLDRVLSIMLEFFKSTDCATIAMAQGGDFIGGSDGTCARAPTLMRKAMNSFMCSTKRRFQFLGRINEDVNTYTRQASTGLLMLSTNYVMLQQKSTQTNAGGMTGLYLDSGTYVKSFYSVIFHPSSIGLRCLATSNSRIHHRVRWRYTVPKILRETHKGEQ
tara:strand:- start:573 stop:1427 length:855 start_codon:yes stop_codon:yes gene_type:complete